MSTFLTSHRRAPLSDEAAKRRKINQSAAVITHESYVESVKIIKNTSKLPTCPKKPKVDLTSSDEEDSLDNPHTTFTSSIAPKETIEAGIGKENMCMKISDYVIIKLHPELPKSSKSSKSHLPSIYYVGVVTAQVEGSKWKIMCFRRNGEPTSMGGNFVLPPNEDMEDYSSYDIMTIMSQPKLVRGVYHFSDDFSSYGIHLR